MNIPQEEREEHIYTAEEEFLEDSAHKIRRIIKNIQSGEIISDADLYSLELPNIGSSGHITT